jgi:hypothetical protein
LDAAACWNFPREYDLLNDFKLNIETRHETLAAHTMRQELETADAAAAPALTAEMFLQACHAGTVNRRLRFSRVVKTDDC